MSAYRDEELRGAAILPTALLALKYIFRDELRERLPGILGLLRELEQGSSGLNNMMTLLRYLAQGANAERLNATELRQAVVTTLSGGGELMMTIAEQCVQEGLQESLNSVRQLLLRLVGRRFGAVAGERSQALPERITEPPVLEELGEELGEALLDCADGEAWLAALARRVQP